MTSTDLNTKKKQTLQCRDAHITIFPKDQSLIFTADEIKPYTEGIIDTNLVRGYILQGEYTKEKRQHLQIYAQFNRNLSYKKIKEAFNNQTLHIRPITYGEKEHCIKYCTAEHLDHEGNPKDIWFPSITHGKLQTSGSRSDIDHIIDRIKNGERINKMLMEEDTTYAKKHTQYFRTFREIEKLTRQAKITVEILKEYENVEWKPFQQDIITYLKTNPDKRKVKWILDTQGNLGKSYLTKYLATTSDAYIVSGGRKEDILFAYDGQPTIIFDLPRDCQDKEYIYGVIELLKNGQYLNTKYHSEMRLYTTPHIIVFSNFPPDQTKLSEDRWDILDLSPKQSKVLETPQLDYDSDSIFTSHIKRLALKKQTKPLRLRRPEPPLNNYAIIPYASDTDDSEEQDLREQLRNKRKEDIKTLLRQSSIS
jgi:hypothetical protein